MLKSLRNKESCAKRGWGEGGVSDGAPALVLTIMTKQVSLSFVMAGLVPAIYKPLIYIDPRHKAEDDEGEVAGLLTVRASEGTCPLF
ncbi:MAG: hypothetical protein C0457_08055 [Polymorphum sp.]|nr:hypothetical protein [Polymorphum sp.]